MRHPCDPTEGRVAGRAKIGTFAYLSTTQSKVDNYGKSEGDTDDVSVQPV